MSLPSINTKGYFTALTPFTLPNEALTCSSIRTIEHLVASGVDVYNEYYFSNSIAKSDYITDLDNKVSIVTLWNELGDSIKIPSSYLINTPNLSSVPHSRTILSVNLGTLPNDESLDWIVNELTDISTGFIGQDCVVKIHKSDVNETITNDEAETLLTNRGLNKVDNPSLSDQIVSLNEVITRQTTKISLLEDVVIRQNI